MNTKLVDFEKGTKIIDIACGRDHMLALDEHYNVFLHKLNSSKLFMDGSLGRKSIQCGGYHSYIRVHAADCKDDLHFLWGLNNNNQCLTFNGSRRVDEPHCINETLLSMTGGMFVESVSLGVESTTCFVAV